MENAKILIVDDDFDILQTGKMLLKKHFSHISVEREPRYITKYLQKDEFDVILLDMNFKAGVTSGKKGLEWLQTIKKSSPDTQVVMITAYGDIAIAVKAMKEGASDFVVKPWDNEKLLATVTSAFKLSRSKKQIRRYRERESTLTQDINKAFSSIIGNSSAMQEVFSQIDKVSVTEANVLVLGENGTGKELVAREIHRKSRRSDQVFINVDLGAVSESLFESELFGYLKGSFTDAKQDKAGRIEVANGGTLFLDEIGNLALPLQAKMLSVLQNRKIYRIGSTRAIPVDIRLISATNMHLHEMTRENRFREDLLYRINTIEIKLPALRERKGDIPLLADHFLEHYTRKYMKERLKLSNDAVRRMENYAWPGNIRELQHVIERAVIMSEKETIAASDLLLTTEEKPADISGSLNIEHLEKEAIKKALLKHSGNLTNAAKELGLGRTTLYRKMEKYGI